MNEYKIEVANEAESKEVQELFFEMGYAWRDGGKSVQHTKNGYLFISGNYRITFAHEHYLEHFSNKPHQQITLPELRILAMLKRNDVNDATHVDKDGSKWFICGDGCYFFDFNGEWYETNKAEAEAYNPQPIQKKEKDMISLISGKEALMAIVNGEDIQYRFPDQAWLDFTNNLNSSGSNLKVVDLLGDYASFRLKPQTITVTLELPKPFKPEVGDIYWFIYPDVSEGYSFETCENDLGDKNLTQFGAYRTEGEVKQVVEALRAAALEALNA